MEKIKKFCLYLAFIIFNLNSSSEIEIMKNMLRPIEFTKKGIINFIENIYNDTKYKNFLSSCFVHIIDLMEYSQKINNGSIFIQQVLYLFSQKLNESSIVNPHAILYFLQQSHKYMSEIISGEKIFIEKLIYTQLENALIEDFELLQKKPKDFIEKQSKSISLLIEKNYIDYLETQNAYSSLIENAFSKIIFDMKETEESCDCFNQLASSINYYYETGIIKNESIMHRILWSLCIQFYKSIEIQKNKITKNEIEIIKKHISSKLPSVINIEEIEPLIITKKNFLINKINKLF
jgi:hypothetical protein